MGGTLRRVEVINYLKQQRQAQVENTVVEEM